MFGIDDAALALVLGGLISTAGRLYTNRQNISAEEKANEINWEIARLNNATEVEMANTAHQREIADLKAAGLNPILSAGGNGSATPSLSFPSISPVRTDNELFDGLANSVKGLGRYFGELYRTDLNQRSASADLTRAEASLSTSQADVAAIQNHLAKQEANFDLDAWNKAHGIYEVYDPVKRKNVQVIKDQNRYRMMQALRADAFESAVRDASNINWRNNVGTFTGAAVNSAAALERGVGAVNHATKLLRATR